MFKWLRRFFQISPMKGPEDLGAPIPILDPKDNPFVNGDLHDEDRRVK